MGATPIDESEKMIEYLEKCDEYSVPLYFSPDAYIEVTKGNYYSLKSENDILGVTNWRIPFLALIFLISSITTYYLVSNPLAGFFEIQKSILGYVSAGVVGGCIVAFFRKNNS